MKNKLLSLSAACVMLAAASSAQAAQTIVVSGPSGTFGNDDVGCAGTAPCSFSNTFNFTTPTGFNIASATISSVATNDAMTNIDFSSVTLNGVAFTTLLSGVTEFRNLLNQALVTGANNVIAVNGTTGANASYAGTLSFAAVPAVPEPATWAMMLVGFGAVGFSMRRRATTVRFAQAI